MNRSHSNKSRSKRSHSEKSHSFEIGLLAPCVLILIGVLDVGLRFMPIDALAYRPWEAVTHNPLKGAPFEANKTCHKDKSYGDLANMQNLPSMREYRSETFTTDSYGFRKTPIPIPSRQSAASLAVDSYDLTDPPEPGDIHPGALVVGSSFSAGTGANDWETFPADLSRISGIRIYNGAAGGAYREGENLDLILELARKLHMSKGTVLYEFLERDYPGVPVIKFLQKYYPWTVNAPPPKKDPTFLESLLDYPIVAKGLDKLRPFADSRLQILAEKAYRLLQNGRFLPNLNKYGFRTLQFQDGTLMLTDPFNLMPLNRSAFWVKPYFSWLATELGKNNLSLVVYLLPEKDTVYRSMLMPSSQIPEHQDYLSQIEGQLVEIGIPVINTTPALRAAAEKEYEQGRLLYWRDDAHWNPAGIAVAASAVWNYWKSVNTAPKQSQHINVDGLEIGNTPSGGSP